MADAKADTTGPEALIGVWKMVSCHAEVEGEAEPRYPLGQAPNGYLIVTKERRLMALITTGEPRQPPKDDADAAKLLRTLMGYSGRFEANAERFITTPDTTATGSYVGEKQVRHYKVEGDRLTVRSGVQTMGLIPNRRAVTVNVFQREH
ncbi:lipocalin-like domain-containing protein [Ramlibacter sp.]|uniref:lipocalin-like domain-containing protein n=1 Tax=Ramlibacter sp. TaxID=1917967 RepID=UPI003D0BD430